MGGILFVDDSAYCANVVSTTCDYWLTWSVPYPLPVLTEAVFPTYTHVQNCPSSLSLHVATTQQQLCVSLSGDPHST